jgi:nitroreductase
MTSTATEPSGATGQPEATLPDLEALEALAWQRRSNLRVDPDRPVPHELVERLCRLASWAPNHHRTRPWRFCAVTGDGRSTLGEALAGDLIAAGEPNPAKVAKARTKYTRAPVVLVVATAQGPDEACSIENRDAVAAAVQTLLLGATAVGLATLWSSGAATTSAAVRDVCGFDDTDTVVGLVYLGWPIAEANGQCERPAPTVLRLDEGPTGSPTAV